MSIAGPELKKTFNLAAHKPIGWQEGFFTNQYGHRLRYGVAPATTDQKRGTIILAHGYGEFIDQYYLAMQEYQKMGFDVWAMDFYGFGKSGRDNPKYPHRPSAKGMLRHVKDLDHFITDVVTPIPGRPLILSAHSMGGHIGLLYLQRHPGVFDGAVMSSPMFDIFRFGAPAFMRPLVRSIFNLASVVGFKNAQVPATPALWDKITRVSNAFSDTSERGGLRGAFKELAQGAMPDIHIQRPTFGWVSASYKTIAHSMKTSELRKVTIPILIGSARVESLVDIHAHERAAQIMPNATIARFPTAQHFLWFEQDENYNLWLGRVQSFVARIATRFETNPLLARQHRPGGEDPAKALIRAAFRRPGTHDPGGQNPS